MKTNKPLTFTSLDETCKQTMGSMLVFVWIAAQNISLADTNFSACWTTGGSQQSFSCGRGDLFDKTEKHGEKTKKTQQIDAAIHVESCELSLFEKHQQFWFTGRLFSPTSLLTFDGTREYLYIHVFLDTNANNKELNLLSFRHKSTPAPIQAKKEKKKQKIIPMWGLVLLSAGVKGLNRPPPGFGRPRRFHAKRGCLKPKAHTAPYCSYSRWQGHPGLRPTWPPFCMWSVFALIVFTPCMCREFCDIIWACTQQKEWTKWWSWHLKEDHCIEIWKDFQQAARST